MPMQFCSKSKMHCFTSDGKCIPLPCGSWSCPECRRTLSFQWAIRARLGVADKLAYMWTFTQPPGVHSIQFAYRILPGQWDSVRKKCQRLWKSWQYLAVVEGQPHRGLMPHFHVLCHHEMPERANDFAVSCGFGYMAKSEVVRDKKASRYVAKYLTKQADVVPKGFRRVRTSRDWPKLPEYDAEPYIVKSRAEHWLHFFQRAEDLTGVDLQCLVDRWNDATGMALGGDY